MTLSFSVFLELHSPNVSFVIVCHSLEDVDKQQNSITALDDST